MLSGTCNHEVAFLVIFELRHLLAHVCYINFLLSMSLSKIYKLEEGVLVTVTGLRDVYNKGLFFVSYLSNYVYSYLKRTIGLRLVSVF